MENYVHLTVPTVRVTSITSTSISLTHHHFCISQYSLDVLTFTTPSFLYSALPATQPDCQTDNTAAVTGWVVAVVFIITTVAAVIVIAVNHRGHYSTGAQKKYNFMCFCFCESLEMVFLLYRGQMSAVDVTTKSNEAYELTKTSGEPTYM